MQFLVKFRKTMITVTVIEVNRYEAEQQAQEFEKQLENELDKIDEEFDKHFGEDDDDRLPYKFITTNGR